MSISNTTTCAAALAISLAAQSQASITYTSASRSVFAEFETAGFSDDYQASNSAFGLWFESQPLVAPDVEAMSIVSHLSGFHSNILHGSMSVLSHAMQLESPFASALAETRMNVHFSVTEAVPYSFFLGWTTSAVGATFVTEESYFKFYNADDMSEIAGATLLYNPDGEDQLEIIEYQGILEPGNYLIDAALVTGAMLGDDFKTGDYSQFDAELNFQIVVVPSPSGLALLVVAGLGRRRRRD